MSSIASITSATALTSVSFEGQRSTRTQGAGFDPPQDSVSIDPDLQKGMKVMGQLHDLQQSDPTKFKEMASKLADQFQKAADNATDPNAKAVLTSMAQSFTKAAQTGELQPPPGGPGGHHGGHGGGHRAEGTYSSHSANVLTSSSSSDNDQDTDATTALAAPHPDSSVRKTISSIFESIGSQLGS